MQTLSRLRSAPSRSLFGCTLLVTMVGLAAACSGPGNSDDDDDSGGDSGESGKGGSSGRGGSSASGGKGGASSLGGTGGGSAGSSGSSGSSGGTFLEQCHDVCTRGSACPGADAADCASGCDEINSLVTSNVCKAEIEALYDCGSSESDICSSTICSTESMELVNCLVAYCTANESAPVCTG